VAISQRWSSLSGKWNSLFRDHEIYVRTGGDVRFICLSAALQRRAANIAVAIIAFWLLVTVALVGWNAYASWHNRDVATRAVAVEQAEAKIAAERQTVEQIAADLDARQDYLEATVAAHFPGDSAAAEPTGASTGDAPAAAPAIDQVSRLRAIGERQQMLVASLTHAVASRSARAEAALRTVGIRAPGSSRTAQGGPFIPDTRVSVPMPRDPAIRRLAEQIDRMEMLEQLLVALPSNLPADRMELSSGFGYRSDPFNGRGAMHAGLDFKGAHGSPIRAAAIGRVVFAGRKGGYGNAVEIDHGHGIVTRYAHLSGFDVRIGQPVIAGQQIARMGSTGRSTGTHLHFEVRVGGTAVNPRRFLEANPDVLEIQADAGQRVRTRVAAR
jgi:murein DD-endopeptidase MepM/ murein hydrolase activator NlpD